MKNGKYWQGQSIELRVVFLDVAGAQVVASGVTFRVRKPDFTLLTLAAQADAARPNEWVGHVVADQVGEWTVKASCAAPRAAVDQGGFTVMASLPG